MIAKILSQLGRFSRLRLFWLIAVFLILAIFIYLKILPAGEAVYVRDDSHWLSSGKGFIYNFTPQERVKDGFNQNPVVIGEPVYFSVFTPRTFSRVKLIISYFDKLSLKTPIFEAGVLADDVVWRYNLKPLANALLDNIPGDWQLIQEDGLSLWQREEKYQDISSFLEDLNKGNLAGCSGDIFACLVTYNYDPELKFNWTKGGEVYKTKVAIPFRGAHALLLYISEGALDLEAQFIDLNQDRDSDPIKLILTNQKEIVAENILNDDNLKPTEGEGELKKLTLKANNLETGLYRLEFKISDDVVIKNFSISNNRFVFVNKVWPVSYGEKITFYTDSSYLQAKALGPASLQEIAFGGEKFSLSEPYLQLEFYLSNPQEIAEIVLTKDDVILENNSVFSLTREQFFNPLVDKVDRFFIPNSNHRYIIAAYEPPQITSSGLKEASAEFNLIGAYREKGKYNFMLSIPGLRAEDNIEDAIIIDSIRLEMSGRTLWQKIFNIKP